MSVQIPYSEACERNKDVILDVLAPYLNNIKSVLEIGSGTGQHAIHFSRDYRNLQWQLSDQQQYLAGLAAQLENARTNLDDAAENVLAPIELDVEQANWIDSGKEFDLVYSANTLHIMSWQTVCAFFAGLPQVLSSRSVLVIYGPFKYQGKFTSASNQHFDQSLRERGVGSAIRDFEAVNELANKAGLELIEDRPMPANNQCLIWQQVSLDLASQSRNH